jgi:hypothetical protein
VATDPGGVFGVAPRCPPAGRFPPDFGR